MSRFVKLTASAAFNKYIYKSIDKLEDIHSLIDSAIVEEPPFTVREGGMIKRGYNEELDSVTGDMNDSKGILARIEAEQRDITGIPKLKVGYNRVFGYYIEVSNSYKSMVPETYIRKQTLTNCERYITQDLKDVEGRILGAKDRSVALEYNLFDDVRKTVSDNLERIQKTAKAIANLDIVHQLLEHLLPAGELYIDKSVCVVQIAAVHTEKAFDALC
ncbi:DNA mismatch repair protein MutS domain protein [human gut metagenome]|uniref:DNA mismatch repair protein MutS domain protein n=1 Tax=human gut metagenome TaxID=408170 RepID=K1TM19_9ZZZZ